ncbi:MAG: LacI family DNA-binding transcriptional regulator [Propionibacteriaceae bacterium]
MASRAGVTIPTASKALNQRSDVSAATRQRVLEAVAALGYVKARRPSTQLPPSTGLVHLVVSSLHGTFHQLVLSGVETVASDSDLDVVVVLGSAEASEIRDDHGRDWVQRLVDHPSDGAVLALMQPDDEQRDRLAAAAIPWVLLDPRHELHHPAPSVGATNWLGGHAVATHLIEFGHRRIGVLGGQSEELFTAARIDGFRSALSAGGVELDADQVRYAAWNRDAAEQTANELIERTGCTAIFACSDDMAFGVIQAARRRGLRVPADLSVVGFDDLPEARWCYPPLTTVRQPIEAMAAEALRMVLRMRRGEQLLAGRVELPTALVVRQSSGPAPSR